MLTYNCERTITIFSIFQVGQFYDGDAYYVSVLHLQIWLLNSDGAFVFIVFLTFLICPDTCVGFPFSQFFPGAVIPLSCFLYPPFRSTGQDMPWILQFQLPFPTWFSPVGNSTCPWDHFTLWLTRVNQQPQHTMSDGHCVDRRCFSIGFWFPSSLWLLAHLFLFFATYLEITH